MRGACRRAVFIELSASLHTTGSQQGSAERAIRDSSPEEEERPSSMTLAGEFKYYCVVDMQYYRQQDMFKSKCCACYLCHDCVLDYAKNRVRFSDDTKQLRQTYRFGSFCACRCPRKDGRAPLAPSRTTASRIDVVDVT